MRLDLERCLAVWKVPASVLSNFSKPFDNFRALISLVDGWLTISKSSFVLTGYRRSLWGEGGDLLRVLAQSIWLVL